MKREQRPRFELSLCSARIWKQVLARKNTNGHCCEMICQLIAHKGIFYSGETRQNRKLNYTLPSWKFPLKPPLIGRKLSKWSPCNLCWLNCNYSKGFSGLNGSICRKNDQFGAVSIDTLTKRPQTIMTTRTSDVARNKTRIKKRKTMEHRVKRSICQECRQPKTITHGF